MGLFDQKRIADAVHGTIGLSDLEARVLSTRAFQRLRHVRHLGLAYSVFPGADYSRFSHSVGVCHVAGRILSALSDQGAGDLNDDQVQLYRLAALLHDVGHYPFSHVMEQAVADHYKALVFLKSGTSTAETAEQDVLAQATPAFFGHEALGKKVIALDDEIQAVLATARIDAEQVCGIFAREQPLQKYSNLVSSDLDADRIDYLLRTARHTGLPYGAVDIDYLLSRMCVDDKQRICLSDKALRAADHFLLCRYFDYLQVTYHKTVAGMELVLKDVLLALLSGGLVDCSTQAMTECITSGGWSSFDDAMITQRIRALSEGSSSSDANRVRATSILDRLPPKLIVQTEFISDRNEHEIGTFRTNRRLINDHIARWSEEFKIDKSFWYLWEKGGLALTKVGSHVSQSSLYENSDDNHDNFEQEIRIAPSAGRQSRPITELRHSLMNVLADKAVYMLRLYVLIPRDKLELRTAIEKRVRDELPEIHWL
jgi:uncharacterized protein